MVFLVKFSQHIAMTEKKQIEVPRASNRNDPIPNRNVCTHSFATTFASRHSAAQRADISGRKKNETAGCRRMYDLVVQFASKMICYKYKIIILTTNRHRDVHAY